jgi:hypothetical protein
MMQYNTIMNWREYRTKQSWTGQEFSRRDLENHEEFDWLVFSLRYENTPFAYKAGMEAVQPRHLFWIFCPLFVFSGHRIAFIHCVNKETFRREFWPTEMSW